jgi:hypothetical protein
MDGGNIPKAKRVLLMSAHDDGPTPARKRARAKFPAPQHVPPERRWKARMEGVVAYRPQFIIETKYAESVRSTAKDLGVRLATKKRADGRMSVWVLSESGLRPRKRG